MLITSKDTVNKDMLHSLLFMSILTGSAVPEIAIKITKHIWEYL